MAELKAQYVGETELPYPEGTHQGATVYADVDKVGRTARWTLSGMAPAYKFFSADLLNQSGVIRHPVDVYWAEVGVPRAEAPMRLTLDWVALRGMPPPLDRTIYACPNCHAKGLFDYLNKFAVGHQAVPTWEAVHQVVPLVDRSMLKSLTIAPPTPPTVELSVFGLSGAAGAYLWQTPKNQWADPLSLVFLKRHLPPLRDPKNPAKRRRPFSS